MSKMRTQTRGAVALVVLLVVAGCGSDSDGEKSDKKSDPSQVAPSGRPSGFDSSQFKGIRDCLEAAGLADKFPTDIPSDMPTGIPSDMPTDVPSDMPSGGAGGLSALMDPEVQDALTACGISLPQFPGAAPS